MLENDVYNTDREFDYATVKGTVLRSLEKIAKEEALKHRCNISAFLFDNKSLRLEVHHPKAFDEICTENNISTIEQALQCKELWNFKNGFSICYKCHKDVENIRTKLRNMFSLALDYRKL